VGYLFSSTLEKSPIFKDLEDIIKKKKLVVAIHKKTDAAPFRFIDNGVLKGCDIDLAHLIAKTLGDDIKVEFLTTASTYDEIAMQVANSEADIAISNLSYTNERSKHVYYTQKPYIMLYISLLVDRSELEKLSSDIKLNTLFSKENNLSLCVIKGSSHQKVASDIFPFAKQVYGSSSKELIQLLGDKKCIAMLNDSDDVQAQLLKKPELNLNYLSIILKEQEDPNFVIVSPKKTRAFKFYQ
jgi:polar amino acid transport system substrate-binding protein